jgi:hypothetical protein
MANHQRIFRKIQCMCTLWLIPTLDQTERLRSELTVAKHGHKLEWTGLQ